MPGENVSYAGTDIAKGETVLRAGQLLTSREIGVLAAIGLAEVPVYRQPRVAILSTGNEIVAPGTPLFPGAVYDSNAAIIGAAVAELGGVPVQLGYRPDDDEALAAALARPCGTILSYLRAAPPRARVTSPIVWSADCVTPAHCPWCCGQARETDLPRGHLRSPWSFCPASPRPPYLPFASLSLQ